jgi:hypothetical protein
VAGDIIVLYFIFSCCCCYFWYIIAQIKFSVSFSSGVCERCFFFLFLLVNIDVCFCRPIMYFLLTQRSYESSRSFFLLLSQKLLIKSFATLVGLFADYFHVTPWRNGSASDSRSEGCVFKSRRGQQLELFFFSSVRWY